MNNDRLEQELRTYFHCEADAAAPTQDWWQSAVNRAMAVSQPEPRRGLAAWVATLMDILRINPEKPVWGVATMVAVLLVFVVASFGIYTFLMSFPIGMGGAPPASSTPPPMTTITLPTSSPNILFMVFSILVYLSLIIATLSILIRKWQTKWKSR